MLIGISQILSQRCLLDPSRLIVVGVSGGPDSLALLHALHRLGYRLAVAHADHQLRPESGDEAEAVGAVAKDLDLPFATQRLDVRGRARSARLSIEAAAREQRYQFLFGEARRRGAQAVAVGHTADDQVETVLMHLLRGAGLAGLSGMSYRAFLPQFDARVPLVRPLLSTWRHQTEEYCRSQALRPILDSSNESAAHMRNRVRHELLPLLEKYNPRVRAALWRSAQILAEDLAIVQEQVAAAWGNVVIQEGDGVIRLHPSALAGKPRSVIRHVMMRALDNVSPESEIGFDALEGAAVFVCNSGTKRLDLGDGVVMVREPGSIILARSAAHLPEAEWPQLESDSVAVPVHVPAAIQLCDDWQFSAQYVPAPGEPMGLLPSTPDGFSAWTDADALPEGLQLRSARPGDRVRPLGMKGHSRKLSDVFVDAKVVARARRRWPVLCSGNVIVWVPGFAVADTFKLRHSTVRAARFTVARSAQS